MTARTVLRWFTLAVGATSTAIGTAMVILMVFPSLQGSARLLAMASSFIPYGVLAWLIATLAFGLAGRRRVRLIAVACAALLTLQISWTTPYWPHAAAPTEGHPLRVLSANLYFGRADATSVVRGVVAADPDVVVFVEYGQAIDSDPTLDQLKRTYPFRVGTTPPDYAHARRWDASGTQVWSRTPLTVLGTAQSPFTQLAVGVDRPGGQVTVVAAHPVNMVVSAELWRSDAVALADLIRPHLDEPLIVAGDFNATHEQQTMRDLLALGLADAADQSGSGWQPTFPSDATLIPPLIAIDHVLVNHRVASQRVRTLEITGTDHLGLVTDLVVSG